MKVETKTVQEMLDTDFKAPLPLIFAPWKQCPG
jgi:hypothetical protein